MNFMDKKIEEILFRFLRQHCQEKDGAFAVEIYPDYRDEISDSKVNEIVNQDDPWLAFSETLEEMYQDSIDYQNEELVKGIRDLLDVIGKDSITDDEIHCFVQENVEYLLPKEHFLNQEVRVDFLVDTGDGLRDFIANSVPMYPDGYWGYDTIPDEASLVWLAGTQGYSKPELLAVLDGRPCKGFLSSVKEEIENEVSHMNVLVFLSKVSVYDLIRIQEAFAKAERHRSYDTRLHPDVGTITLDKQTMCGLYDKWTGGGSLLEIKLEKDVQLPIKFLLDAVPDSALRSYTIEETYGMCRSAWKKTLKNLDIKTEP